MQLLQGWCPAGDVSLLRSRLGCGATCHVRCQQQDCAWAVVAVATTVVGGAKWEPLRRGRRVLIGRGWRCAVGDHHDDTYARSTWPSRATFSFTGVPATFGFGPWTHTGFSSDLINTSTLDHEYETQLSELNIAKILHGQPNIIRLCFNHGLLAGARQHVSPKHRRYRSHYAVFKVGSSDAHP